MQPEPSPQLTRRQLGAEYDHLAPDGSEIRELSAATRGGLAHCTLPAAAVSRAVRHRTVEELWYCIAGSGRIWRKLGDTEATVTLVPGVSLAFPVGAQFQFRNDGAEPLCLLILTMPPWPGADEAVPVPEHWPSA